MPRIHVRIMLAVLATALASTATAARQACNNATVAGTYSFQGQSQWSSNKAKQGFVIIVHRGVIMFNPTSGRYSNQSALQDSSGNVKQQPPEVGSYQVDATCHFSMQRSTSSPIWRGILSNEGSTITGGFIDQGHQSKSIMTRTRATY
jgi:hypothetical protein